MPCEHNFGIIENFDKNKDYSNFDEFGMFPDAFPNALKTYMCVNIDDDALNGWWPHIKDMKVYHHSYSRPDTALARYGVTLIPPESLDMFYDVVASNTDSEYIKQVKPLLDVIATAKQNDKFAIHFGV